MIRPYENIPNINIVYTRDNPLGSWTPKEYQNSAGVRIPYTQPLTGQFQYPKQQQMGGNINTTGYTPGTPTMNNDHNIIPGNHITSKPMDNNTLLYVTPIYPQGLGNNFLYKKGMRDVIDKNAIGFLERKYPFYKHGGIVEGEFEIDTIDKNHLEYLKNLGYSVEIL
jgi:hypothetical protein